MSRPTWPTLHWWCCQRGPTGRPSATALGPHHPSHAPDAPAAPQGLCKPCIQQTGAKLKGQLCVYSNDLHTRRTSCHCRQNAVAAARVAVRSFFNNTQQRHNKETPHTHHTHNKDTRQYNAATPQTEHIQPDKCKGRCCRTCAYLHSLQAQPHPPCHWCWLHGCSLHATYACTAQHGTAHLVAFRQFYIWKQGPAPNTRPLITSNEPIPPSQVAVP
jgi:hypothetical protein